MANQVEKLNTIAIADIEKVNTLTDDNIEKINTLEFAGTSSFRFFRLYIVDCISGSNAYIDEWEIMVGATAYPTSNMTGPSSPSPLVASASSTFGSNAPWKAFNGAVGSGNSWVPTSATNISLKIDLGSGNEIAATGTKIAPRNAEDGTLKTFRVEGSNTGDFSGEETVLDSEVASSGWSAQTLREFTF